MLKPTLMHIASRSILGAVAAFAIAMNSGADAASKPHPQLKVKPRKIRFARVEAGNQASAQSRSVTISNTGDVPLEISITGAAPPFSMTEPDRSNLGPGQSETVAVSFSPAKEGEYRARLSIMGSAGSGIGSKSRTVKLVGAASSPRHTPTPTPSSTPTPRPTATPTPTPTASPTPGPGGGAFPAHFFAPYVDMTLWPTFGLADNLSSVGKYYTLAFIVDGGGCTASWGGYYTLDQNFPDGEIAATRAAGGQVIVSFGGAAGTELALGCSSAGVLQAQYEAVIARYGLKRVDFDVEGAAVADPQSISRRNQALANLQAAHPGLQVSYTLPVLPSGLTPDGVAVVADAVAKGVDVTTVNVMAMDYGWPDNRMGQDAIDAALATRGQLAALYPAKSQAALNAMLGVTPMIGVNDVPNEVFQLADAQLLANYAISNGFGTLSFWSASRDLACAPGQNWAPQNTCSNIAQDPFEFSGIFRRINP